ncbi:serine--tRNA ligase [Hamadaea tsunoensis]|uniref:serine--tRNA ligase n=1 Tax=Hamadaea tsunoensis TaxID=53368 RepID=UPI0004806BD9|nr:serine--tRNA ligase [Hamadaea tsunoensis]
MIDLRLLREDPDLFRASQRARGESESSVDRLIGADEARRSALTRFEAVRSEQKTLGKQVPRSQGEEKAALLERTKELAAEVKTTEAAVAEAEEELRLAQLAVPNLVESGAPAGGEDDYVVLKEIGAIPDIPEPRDHLALGEMLGAIDMERGAKVSGARFYYLTGIGALLENAVLQLGIQQAVEYGFTPMVPPVLVKPESMEGTGFLGAHASEVYYLQNDDLFLVGTSEVPLAAYHKDEILNLDGQPRRYLAWSTCFRREAGSYGKDTRGIIRVHQFNKAEMFSYCPPDLAHEEHLRLLGFEEEFLAKLELPYRVIDTAAGDLGSSAARKYDCEAWLPSQQRYREVTSTSNCTTFQARRLNVRYRDAEGKTQTVSTLNGTLATTRMLVAILENHQQPDGSVRVPKALQPLLGRDLLEPVA